MHKLLLVFILLLSATMANSQTFLVQEDFSSGIPSAWQVIDDDGHPLHSSMTAFTDAWIPYVDGTDSVVASSSYFDDTLSASDYLILPKQTLLTFSKFSWEARSVDPAYPERYHVLLSTTDSNLTSFTDTLLTVYDEFYLWNRKSVWLDTMGFANQPVFIAFQNFTEDGFILELDDVWLEVSDFSSIETNPISDLKVYPNPAEDIVNLSFAGALISGNIYDLQGRVLIQFSSNTVNVSELNAGQYIIALTTENGIFSQPFIKQ